jgi:macrodomain Ter protein organizer (MatP/YcbG family)
MKQSSTIVTSIRFPFEVYEEIRKIARREHRTISQQIVYFCEQAMNEHLNKEPVTSE